MRQKLFILFVFLLCISNFCNAQTQKTALVKGKLLNSRSKTPFNDLKITMPELSAFTTSDGDGNFEISEVPYGKHVIIISGNGAKSDTMSVNVDMDIVDLHDITITPEDKTASPESTEIPTIALNENGSTSAGDDDGVSSQNAGAAISSVRDPFLGAVAELFALYNFHYRGFQNNPHEFQVNGYPLNDLETNSFSWNQLGKLYDVFRNRDVKYGISPSDYTFGSINGSAYYDASAANQWKETKIAYTFGDRNYSNGFMITQNSGPTKNGWAYSASFAKRYAKEGYAPGTFYDDYSYFAAVSKTIKKGTLNLTTFGSPIAHGKAGSATKEVFELAGNNYFNPNWGYYDGVKRNARVEKLFRPITVLNYEYNPSDKTRWNNAIGYEFGKDRVSFLEGYNAPNPIGTYYRNLPSYYLTMVPPDSSTAAMIRSHILQDPTKALQIDWDRMYQANLTNTQTLYNINGIPGNNYTGKQSIYVQGNYVKDLKKFTYNSNIEHSINEHATVYGGLTITSQQTENYKELADLLGGDYYINYNIFASQQYVGSPNYNQNNIDHPNAKIVKGDKFGDDYTIKMMNSLLWGQAVYNYNRFDMFLSANAGDYSFSRQGFMRNGLFPNNSFGKSATQNFITYAVKGGINCKISPRNTLFINGLYSLTPPSADNTYISAGTRDITVSNPVSQKNMSVEGGYLLRGSRLTARVVGYVTDMKDITEIKRFYNDDPAYYTFVNYVMQGVNTRSIGTELSLNYKLTKRLNVTGVAAIGQSFYTNRPNINVFLDNDTVQISKPEKAFIKNYYLSSGPQTTYIVGLNYRANRDYFVNIHFNYFDRNYVEINPNRRTSTAAGLYAAGSPEWHEIFDQEKLPSVFTVDLRGGKTFQLSRMSKMFDKLSHSTVLVLSASIGNLLNNTNNFSFGYEQLRFDYTHNNPEKFANKYIYAMGINFSVTASLRF